MEPEKSPKTAYNCCNLLVEGLVKRVTDERLYRAFDSFGKIVSAVVMRIDKKKHNGYGYVCFSNPENAKNAMKAMQGLVIGDSQIRISIAEGVEDVKLHEEYFHHAMNMRLYYLERQSSYEDSDCESSSSTENEYSSEAEVSCQMQHLQISIPGSLRTHHVQIAIPQPGPPRMQQVQTVNLQPGQIANPQREPPRSQQVQMVNPQSAPSRSQQLQMVNPRPSLSRNQQVRMINPQLGPSRNQQMQMAGIQPGQMVNPRSGLSRMQVRMVNPQPGQMVNPLPGRSYSEQGAIPRQATCCALHGYRPPRRCRRRPKLKSSKRRYKSKEDAPPPQQNPASGPTHYPPPLTLAYLEQYEPEEQLRIIRDRLQPMVRAIQPAICCKVTKFLLTRPITELLFTMANPDDLRDKVVGAVGLLRMNSGELVKQRKEQ